METGERWPNVDMMIRLAEAMRIRPREMLDVVVARDGRLAIKFLP